MVLAFSFVFATIGGSAVNGLDQTWRSLDTQVAGWDWDLVGWEVQAIGEKVATGFAQPAAGLSVDERRRLVREYMTRAGLVGELEDQINQIYSDGGGTAETRADRLQAEVDALRTQQETIRPTVEQIIQGQVGAELVKAGIQVAGQPLPPVLFTFTDPPKKLIVSPRSRIATVYYSMLRPDLPAAKREEIEEGILKNDNLSAYVTNIGGLGAFPTQVVDQASLSWVLSTVAHEWTHNYLSFFPLGLNYSTDSDLTILNETVADIVGDEIGARALRTFYPELVRDHPGKDESAPLPGEEAKPFDFRKEMRQTREVVDQFLKWGRVQDAEEYMEIRRLLFRENGYNLRKLNQAYFAFHGSYGTGAAATSPIGPKLQQLRQLAPDLPTFVAVVRGFTSAADLDRALATWDSR